MFYCKPIHIEGLDEIKSSVLNLIPEEDLATEVLFYPRNNKDLFLSIDPLKQALKELGWLDKINKAGFALNIVDPKSEIVVHLDSGSFPYSFNIPITHCKDSFLNFYRTKEKNLEPKEIRKHVSYYSFDRSDCEIIKSYEISSPFLMNVKTLHNVINNSIDRRVTLLVRLSHGIDIGTP